MTLGFFCVSLGIEPNIELVYNHGLKAKDLKRALSLAEMYKDDIIEVWNKYHLK